MEGPYQFLLIVLILLFISWILYKLACWRYDGRKRVVEAEVEPIVSQEGENQLTSENYDVNALRSYRQPTTSETTK